jgi:hypothetical protein
MKKSKFLKKSLAMLLALMLVVAMIPLSASAASSNLPDLSTLTIGGSTVAVEADGTTFKAEIDESADSVKLAATVSEGAKLTIAKNGSVTSEKVDGTEKEFKFADYATESGSVVTLTMTLTSEDGSNTKTYKVELTRVTKSDLTNLESVTPGDKVLAATFDNNAKTVTVTVPYGYSNDGSITVKTADDATVTSTTISNITDGTTTFTVSSASSDVDAEWTVKVNEVAPISAFSIDGVEGVWEDNTSDGKVDTVTVTLDSKQIQDEDGVDKTNPKLPVSYTVLAETTVEWDVNASETLTNGNSYALTGITSSAPLNGKTLTVTCKGVASTYILNIKVAESSDKEITYAQLESKIATISGNSISAVLPASADLTDIDLIFRTATTAKVTSVSTPVGTDTETVSPGTDTDTYKEFKATVDLTKGATVTVTAQDGTTKQYIVTATKSSQATDAKLTNVSLKNGDTVYDGSISGTTVTFTVPYMTTSTEMAAWKLFVTPNGEATAYKTDGSTPIVSGTATANDLGTLTAVDTAASMPLTLTDAIVVKNDNNPSIVAKYTVVIKLETAKAGKTLSTLNVTAADSGTLTTDKAIAKEIKDSNTLKASVDNSKKTVTINQAHSHTGLNLYPIDFTTAAGGVAFVGTKGTGKYETVERLTALDKNNGTDIKASDLSTASSYIIVLPEEIAKQITGTEITDAQAAYGTVYEIKVETAAASNKAALSALSVKDNKLTISGQKITATVPYGLTVEDGETLTEDNTYFLNFTVSDYATLGDGADNKFLVDGIKAGETEASGAADSNAKIAFVRTADNKVVVNVWDGTGSTPADADTAVDALVVTAEDTKSTATYTFTNMKYADANTGAEITSFRVANRNGSISGRTITVAVPFGTDLMGLIPTFTTSAGAKVTIGTTEVESGKTAINFSNDVTLLVTSEDGNTTVAYTVKVTTADQFSDVNEGDWYYANVMRAVDLGILSGYSDGTFRPMNNITRRDFAIMLAQSLGHSNDEPATSPFKDVADDDYGVSSIAYLYEQGITAGDDKGNFNPDVYITRQEAAIFLARAFEATGTTSETFTDDAKIASWAKEYVYACKAAGLMNGDTNGTFRPTSTLTRAEAASAMVNALNK